MPETLYARPLRLTEAEYRKLEAEMIGVCRKCRHRQGPIEEDAHGDRCQSCGMPAVDGIGTLLECGHIDIIETRRP